MTRSKLCLKAPRPDVSEYVSQIMAPVPPSKFIPHPVLRLKRQKHVQEREVHVRSSMDQFESHGAPWGSLEEITAKRSFRRRVHKDGFVEYSVTPDYDPAPGPNGHVKPDVSHERVQAQGRDFARALSNVMRSKF